MNILQYCFILNIFFISSTYSQAYDDYDNNNNNYEEIYHQSNQFDQFHSHHHKKENKPHHPGYTSRNSPSPSAKPSSPSSPQGNNPIHHHHKPHPQYQGAISGRNYHNPQEQPGIPMDHHDNSFQHRHSMDASSYQEYHHPHHGMNSYHHSSQPQQNIQYSSSNNKSWYSGPLGTLYEIMMLFFLIGLVYNCIFGKTHNDKYAIAWYNANKEYFEERYERIGLEKSEIEEIPKENVIQDSIIIKETPFFYKIICTNYRYIKWTLTALEFHRRFDATSILTSLFFNDKDKLVYQVAFNPVEPLGWVFCVCRKRDAKGLRSSYQDIEFFTKEYQPSVMSDRMCLLSENVEVFMELFNNKTLFPYYKEVEPYLEVIYFTDQNSFCKEQFAVFFSFDINLTINGSAQQRKFLEITHFVNLFVDTLARLKYSNQFKEDIKKNRIMLERSKMEEGKRKEIEEKEKRDFIEKWKIKNKMKGKKGLERRKLQKELEKYQ